MPVIKQNDIVDVVYDTICGYKPEEAFEILKKFRAGAYMPIDWADEKVDKYYSETVKLGWEELKHLWEGYGSEGYAIWQRCKELKKLPEFTRQKMVEETGSDEFVLWNEVKER